MLVLFVYLSVRFFNSCRCLPETKRHSSLFLHSSGSKFLVVMAACTPSIHVFLGRRLFLLSCGVQSIINFGKLLVCHRAPPQVADRGTLTRYGGYRRNKIPGVDQN